jgi:hypothetical protein
MFFFAARMTWYQGRYPSSGEAFQDHDDAVTLRQREAVTNHLPRPSARGTLTVEIREIDP